ncbi:hypothetical protein D3C78_617010 [compost metagenome]
MCTLRHGSGRSLDQLGVGRILQRIVIYPLRSSGGPVRRVNIKTIAVRIFFQHRLGAFAQLVGILTHVLRSDAEQRFFMGKWITALATILEAGINLGITAIPRRNSAVGIARALSAQRGEAGVELGGLIRRNGCKAALGSQQGSSKRPQVEGSSFILVHG